MLSRSPDSPAYAGANDEIALDRGKDIGNAPNQVRPGLHRPDLVGIAFQLKVGGETARAVVDRDRETAGDAEHARHLPAADGGVEQAVRAVDEPLAAPDGQFIDPVGVYLVSNIERRNALLCVRIPGVDDVVVEAEEAAIAAGPDALASEEISSDLEKV